MYRSFYGTCIKCGKRRHKTKEEARREARELKKRDGKRRTVYRCNGAYHAGRLSEQVRRGESDRRSVYDND